MREVGEPEPAAEQRRVGELERVPGFDELGRRATTNGRRRLRGTRVGATTRPARPSSPEDAVDEVVGGAERVLGPQRGIEAVGGQVRCDVGVG